MYCVLCIVMTLFSLRVVSVRVFISFFFLFPSFLVYRYFLYIVHCTRARYTIEEHLNHATTILCTKMLLFLCFITFCILTRSTLIQYKLCTKYNIYIKCSSFGKSSCSHLNICNYSLMFSSTCGILHCKWGKKNGKQNMLNLLPYLTLYFQFIPVTLVKDTM